ncbi:MAG TPA: hypoxanthine phosphoribosyltransferase [Actinobacteria bacterium]|nr:hypoxanthine phosphoribosyltransferase [Actinomycetota bacterium]
MSIIDNEITSAPKVGNILLTKQQIKTRIKELADDISKDYPGKKPLLIGILKGAAIFLSDLAREIKADIEVDYMAVSSYGATTKTSGVVRILKDLDEDIQGRHVIIIEDIIDSGLTLSYLIKNLASRDPASLEICSLLRKKDTQKLSIDVKYQGFSIENIFVVGFGLDYQQEYRNLKDIRVLENAHHNNGY